MSGMRRAAALMCIALMLWAILPQHIALGMAGNMDSDAQRLRAGNVQPYANRGPAGAHGAWYAAPGDAPLNGASSPGGMHDADASYQDKASNDAEHYAGGANADAAPTGAAHDIDSDGTAEAPTAAPPAALPDGAADMLRERADEVTRAIDDAAQAQLDALDIAALQSAADRLSAGVDVRALLAGMLEGEGVDAEALLRGVLGMLASLMRGRAGFMLAMLCCFVLAGMASRICEGGARVSEMTCLCVTAGLVAGDIASLAGQAREALSAMGSAADALLPLISGAMAAAGARTSAGLLGGLLTAVAGAGMQFGREHVIGMAMVSAALEICSGLTPRLNLRRAAELLRSLCGMLVGAALVLALGAMTINGMAADVDGVSVRAAKYALDNLVPVVGGQLKDTVEIMTASCMMVQSLIGSCGMLILLMGAARPAATLAAAYISYKICAAAAQTLGGTPLSDMCEGLAGALRVLVVAVLGAAALMIMLLGAMGTAARSLMAG